MSTSKVHVVIKATKRPVCGANLGPTQQFQFCAGDIYMQWVECKHCLRWLT